MFNKKVLMLIGIFIISVIFNAFSDCVDQTDPIVNISIDIPEDQEIHAFQFSFTLSGTVQTPVFYANSLNENATLYDSDYINFPEETPNSFKFTSGICYTDPNNHDLGWEIEIISSANPYEIKVTRMKHASPDFDEITSVGPQVIIHMTGLAGTYSISSASDFDYWNTANNNVGFTPADAAAVTFSPCVDNSNQAPSALFISENTDEEVNKYNDIQNIWYATVPLKLLLNGENSSDDDGTISGYTWTVTGATTEIDMDTSTPEIIFNETGEKIISLAVTDDDGTDSGVVTKTLFVLPDPNITFPTAHGLPYDDTKEPLIDGQLSGDDSNPDCTYNDVQVSNESGWRGSLMHTYAYGTDFDVSFRVLKERNKRFLYFGIEVHDDVTPAADDAVIIGLRNSTGADRRFTPIERDTDRLIVIDYSKTDELQIFSPSDDASMWELNGTLETDALNPSVPDDGLTYGKMIDGSSDWSFELRLPAEEIESWDGIDEEFMFFIDILVSQDGAATNQQYSWPREAVEVTILPSAAETGLDPVLTPLWWGNADLTGGIIVNGISIPDAGYIGVAPDADPENPLTNLIKPNEDNLFVAKILNNSQRELYHDFEDGAGEVPAVETLPADDMLVTFYLANWGIPSMSTDYWKPIPGSPNPIPADLSAIGTGVTIFREGSLPAAVPQAFTMNWNPGSAALSGYDEHKHQCILAEIGQTETSQSEAEIITRSVYKNMNFDINDSDAFTLPAEISSFGYGPPPEGQPAHKILLRIFTKEWTVSEKEITQSSELVKRLEYSKKRQSTYLMHYSDNIASEIFIPPAPDDIDTPEIPMPPPIDNFIIDIPFLISRIPDFAKPEVLEKPYLVDLLPVLNKVENPDYHFIEYIVKGYLYTGKTIRTGGITRDIVRPIGSYGHVIRHNGETSGWNFHIAGAEKINNNTYLLTILPESTLTIIDTVDALEPEKSGIFASGGGGAVFPLCDLSANYNKGYGVQLSAGFFLSDFSSLGLVYEYNSLPLLSTGIPWELMSLSLNARYYFNLFPFFDLFAGIKTGIYFDNTGYFNFGAAPGLGFEYILDGSISFEICADFNYLFLPQSCFLSLRAAMVYCF